MENLVARTCTYDVCTARARILLLTATGMQGQYCCLPVLYMRVAQTFKKGDGEKSFPGPALLCLYCGLLKSIYVGYQVLGKRKVRDISECGI